MKEELIEYLNDKIKVSLIDLGITMAELQKIFENIDSYSASELDKITQELSKRKTKRKSEIYAYEEIIWYLENR